MGFIATSGGALTPVKLAGAGAVFDRLARKDGIINQLFSQRNWKSMAGVDVPPIYDTDNPKPSVAPITEYNDLSGAEGGDQIKIPVTGFLSGQPVGDAEVEGLEESIPIFMKYAYLNVLRKAVSKATGMNAARLASALLSTVNDSEGWLHDWNGSYWTGAYQQMLLTGFDPMLTTYNNLFEGTQTQTPYSHPNIYVAGEGQLSYTAAGSGVPGSAGWESYTRGKLANLIGAVDRGPTVDRVMYCQTLANDANIPQVKVGGRLATIWLVDQWWLYALKQTDAWKSYHKDANVRGFDNPLLSAASAYIEGNYFYVIPGMWGVQVSGDSIATQSGTSLSMPAYGPAAGWWVTNNGKPADTNEIKSAIILGPGAGIRVRGRKVIEFVTNGEPGSDYGWKKGVAMHQYQNVVRSDIKDPRNEAGGGADAIFQNNSSFATFWNVKRPVSV